MYSGTRVDLRGKTFGDWTVIGPWESRSIGASHKIYWMCRCKCKIEKFVGSRDLTTGKSTQCAKCSSVARRLKIDIGTVFGQWTVVGHLNNGPDGTTVYPCICSGCDRQKMVSARGLLRGGTTGCGSCKARRLPIGGAPRNSCLESYKRQAKNRGILWSLTDKQFDFITQQDCFYCGAKPSNVWRDRRCGQTFIRPIKDFIYSGIDRKNNDLVYSVDTTVPCCIDCNRAKRKMSFKEFMSWISRLAERQKKIGVMNFSEEINVGAEDRESVRDCA